MYSVKDEFKEQALKTAMDVFAHRQPSSILDHGRGCCLIGKEWFLAMDRGLNGNSTEPPKWLRERFAWGPSRWPLYWCEAVQRDILDCGGLAALAREGFMARGIVALATQLIRFHSPEDSGQWHVRWSNEGLAADWIHGQFIYHEAVAVVKKKTIQLWDPSENFWIDPELQLGYTGTVAIRIISASLEVPSILQWGEYQLLVNSWKSIFD
jgi:hypothetical protein